MEIKEENQKKKNNSVNKKIYRIIKLYAQVTSGSECINIDQYCAAHKITERTLRRDIRVLNDIFPELYFYVDRNWS